MAWTAAKTWTDGEVPDAADLNAISDNLDAYAQHGHNASSGSGANTLAPLDRVTYLQRGDVGSAGTAVITWFDASSSLVWRDATGSIYRGANAGHEHTGSMITPGGATSGATRWPLQGSNVRISHQFGSVGIIGTGTAATSTAITNFTTQINPNATATLTVGGSGTRGLVAYGWMFLNSRDANNRTVHLQMVAEYAGTNYATAPTGSHMSVTVGSFSPPTNNGYFVALHLMANSAASGSYRLYFQAYGSPATSNMPAITAASIWAAEFKVN